eukprot:4113583-Alexandrium_andersonii.AAC.1
MREGRVAVRARGRVEGPHAPVGPVDELEEQREGPQHHRDARDEAHDRGRLDALARQRVDDHLRPGDGGL